MISQILTGTIIAALIAFWCLFDSRTSAGITRPRPYGIAALLTLGALIVLGVPFSPYLVAALSFIASFFFFFAVIGLTSMASTEYASQKTKALIRLGILILTVATAAVAYGLGSTAALAGAILAAAPFVFFFFKYPL